MQEILGEDKQLEKLTKSSLKNGTSTYYGNKIQTSVGIKIHFIVLFAMSAGQKSGKNGVSFALDQVACAYNCRFDSQVIS